MTTGRTPTSARRRAWTWLERGVTLALGAWVLWRLGPQLAAWTGVGPDLGRAPEYAFTALDGTSVRSADLRGQVVVLNFWATWCGPCRLEMPSLQALHDELGGDGLSVIGLSTDAGGDAPIRAFLDERSIDYPVGRATAEIRRAFGGIRGIPTTFIIDRDGTVQHRVVGYFAPPAMRAAVRRLVVASAEPADPPQVSAGTASAR